MNNFIIATVSTADLPAEYMEEHHVPFISYSYTIDDQIFVDDCKEESRIALFKAMRQDKQPNTSQITEYAYYEFFKELLETGKDILFVDMSRAISGSIVNCEHAIESLRVEYPNQKIYFLDSYCITGPLGLLVKQLVKRKEEGMSFEDVCAWGEEHKLEYIHRFTVDDLKWLKRGGRLSNASAFVGTLLSIKPLLYVRDDGVLFAFDKVRGHKKAMRALVDSCAVDLADYTGDEEMVIISADNPDVCEELKTMLVETYPQLKNAPITIITLGPVIGAHVGPDFFAIAYHGTNRVNY